MLKVQDDGEIIAKSDGEFLKGGLLQENNLTSDLAEYQAKTGTAITWCGLDRQCPLNGKQDKKNGRHQVDREWHENVLIREQRQLFENNSKTAKNSDNLRYVQTHTK